MRLNAITLSMATKRLSEAYANLFFYSFLSIAAKTGYLTLVDIRNESNQKRNQNLSKDFSSKNKIKFQSKNFIYRIKKLDGYSLRSIT